MSVSISELNGVGVIRGLSAEGVRILADKGRPRSFAKGGVLVRQGEVAETVHVIVRGRVRVERAHPALVEPLVLAELGPDEVVGEMGVLDGEPRSASAVAEEPTETRELTAALLAELVDKHPVVAAGLLRVLSTRLRSTNEILARATAASAPTG